MSGKLYNEWYPRNEIVEERTSQKRSQRYPWLAFHPGFAENPICSLKQLFTVTSVNRRYFCSQQGKWIGAESPRMLLQYTSPATVTHSSINFGGRSIDHNVLFCSLVFLPAAFDSIRGCGESIYLSRCHEPPVMDGGCSLTLTPKREAVPRTYPGILYSLLQILIFIRRLLLTSCVILCLFRIQAFAQYSTEEPTLSPT